MQHISAVCRQEEEEEEEEDVMRKHERVIFLHDAP